MASLWVSLNVQTKPMLWSLQLYLLLLLQQCPHLLRFMPHLQAKKRLSKGSKCWDHMIIIWSTRLSWSVKMIHDVCVCVSRLNSVLQTSCQHLPAAHGSRKWRLTHDSWPQYSISFVIQKSGQIIAAPATWSRSNMVKSKLGPCRAPAEVGWMLWDISSSNPIDVDFPCWFWFFGILQVFGLTWRDSRRKRIISSPLISCFRTKATSGGKKRGSGL